MLELHNKKNSVNYHQTSFNLSSVMINVTENLKSIDAMPSLHIRSIDLISFKASFFFTLDAYSPNYVKLSWENPPISRSGRDLRTSEYTEVEIKTNQSMHEASYGSINLLFLLIITICFD